MTAAITRPLARPAILLVDDDSFMLDLQSQMLLDMGYTSVATAAGGQYALDGLNGGSLEADIVLCDLNMPGMDGIAFLQELNRGRFAGGVILLSGEGVRIMHTVQRLLRGGSLTILGALEKPARPDSLGALLNSWVPARNDVAVSRPGPLVTEAEIHDAADAHQWVLHYQPKVSLCSGALIGLEALVRWEHPCHGLVYPDQFIHLCEELERIDDLTQWVLCNATRQLARWNADGLRLQVAVNVSMDNLRAPGFAPGVGAIARAAGVSPQDVTLEITESQAMSLSPTPLESLVRLRLQRFNLSIDDFGTGHSSLAQLRDVPFTELKIDRGFVHGARTNQIIRPMLEGSIGIAKKLGMVSVAEGVESEADFEFLVEAGCDVAQGYFIGRPMTPERLAQWTENWEVSRTRMFAS